MRLSRYTCGTQRRDGDARSHCVVENVEGTLAGADDCERRVPGFSFLPQSRGYYQSTNDAHFFVSLTPKSFTL